MKKTKKILSVLLAVLLIGALFTGCAQKSGIAEEITEDTMLIAYTEECEPFLYTNANGELDGFEAKLVESIFDSIKGEYKNYKFVKVDADYELDENGAYTDADGNEYKAVMLCGAMHKNTGTVNEDYVWSENIIENNIITVVPSGSSITAYNNIQSARVGVYSQLCSDALDKQTTIKDSLASFTAYNSAEELLAALDAGEIDAAVIDDFSFRPLEGASAYTVLNGALDTVEYGFAFARSNDFSETFNEAVKEMLSPDYGDGDTLTPLVTEYFGYPEACVFDYGTEE